MMSGNKEDRFKGRESRHTQILIRIRKEEKLELEQGAYLCDVNLSEFVRRAIKEKLERIGVLKTKGQL
jgi:hypothetical protein